MNAIQFRGTHYLGVDTRERFPSMIGSITGWLPEETKIEWFYSDAESNTDIPNRGLYTIATTTDGAGNVLSESVGLNNEAAAYRFTDLDDEVQDYGYAVDLPHEFGRNYVVLSGGWRHTQKARTYEQLDFSLGPLDVADSGILDGTIDQVFADRNILNPANNFVFDQQGTNQESYIAATMTDAAFVGGLDVQRYLAGRVRRTLGRLQAGCRAVESIGVHG